MIADYKDTCQEREELLYSLADVIAVLAKKRVYVLFCFSFPFLLSSFSIPLHSLILHILFSNPYSSLSFVFLLLLCSGLKKDTLTIWSVTHITVKDIIYVQNLSDHPRTQLFTE